MHTIAIRVGDDLKFDVARILQEFLHVDRIVIECGTRLALGQGDGTVQSGLAMHHSHATTSAAASRLDDNREADAPGDAQIFIVIVA